MKILFVLAFYHPYVGGVEQLFKQLGEGLVKKGHNVKVITSNLQGKSRFEVINGVEVERIWVPYSYDRHFFTFLSIPKVLKDAPNYDIVHTTWYNGAVPGFIGAKVTRRPVVFTALEILGKRWRLISSSRLAALFFQTVENIVALLPYDRYVAISQKTYEDSLLIGTKPGNARVIHCGIDEIFNNSDIQPDIRFRQSLGIAPSDFMYLYYGRPGVTKGVEHLVGAAPSIQAQIPNSHLVLILGKEPANRYLKIQNIIREIGDRAKIHIVDPTPDRGQLVSYLLTADCIVIPSLSEGFGLTTAESCALGIPVVASRVGSIPEVISGKYVLVDPGNKDDISKGVVQTWKGEYDAWKTVKNFRWPEMVEQYEKVYQEITQDGFPVSTLPA